MRRIPLEVTTDASGNAVVKSATVSGKVHSVVYVPDGSNAYPNTVDVTITTDKTGESIVTRSNVAAGFAAYPRVATSAPDGTASLFAAGGTAVQDKIALAGDAIKVTLVQGGAAKTGTFHVLLDN